jgi:hypothetical protein
MTKLKTVLLAAGGIALAVGVGLVVATGRSPFAKPEGDFRKAPVIEFQGRVYDHETGKGVPDAFVIINMESYTDEPVTGHGVSGCVGGEVVRTDAQGRYQFRWTWAEYRKKPPDDLTVMLKAYAQGWEYYPRERRLGTPWQTTTTEGPDIVMTKDEATFDERLTFIAKLNDNACSYGPRGATFASLLDAQYREYYAGYCLASGTEYADLAWERFRTFEAFAIAPRVLEARSRLPIDSTGELESGMWARLMERTRANLPAFHRPDPSLSYRWEDRDLTPEEKAIACRDIAPNAVTAWRVQ